MTADRQGVRFPRIGADRSSTATAPGVLADSLALVDPDLADRVRPGHSWRQRYVDGFSASTRLSVTPKASVSIAEEGLRSLRSRLVMVDGDAETPMQDWLDGGAGVAASHVGSSTIHGCSRPATELAVPYRGRRLCGAELEQQLHRWVTLGVVEPGFADAIRLVMQNPSWLSMPGHRVVILGAAAAMGPLEALSAWGADVVAIDIPVPAVQKRIADIAARGAGKVTVPMDRRSALTGLDIPGDLATSRAWLREVTDGGASPVLSIGVYADGAAHVEANLACDVLATDLTAVRHDAMLAFLNTPTDSFLVPQDAVQHARQKAATWRWNGPAHRLAGAVSGGRLFASAYAETYADDLGQPWGLSDTLVPVQGPNYALAKRLQRWRAVLEHDAGRRVSSTVAPASWTRSVTKNRVLKSVYTGAAPFGIEIFEADTARTLMAAKLVADAFRALPGRDSHPEGVFADAAHGGLWRQPFDPRSALSVAALAGAPGAFLNRSR